jgi:GLPGLI family protein
MKYYLPVLLLFLLPLRAASQKSFIDDSKYLATYMFKYQSDSTDVNSVKSEEMQLFLGSKSSKFSSAGKAVKDRILKNRKRENKSAADFAKFQSQIPKTSLYYAIFKHYPSAKISFTEDIATDEFRYSQEMNLFNWNIEEERKQIAGYMTQKATTTFAGRDYIAWFTPEIPIPDGPYKFNGLPGLILEIRDKKSQYVFQLTQFKSLEEPAEIEFNSKNYITTNKEKFLKVKKEYDKDPLAAVELAGLTFDMDPEVRAKMHREHLVQLKKKNNPLELE